MYSLKSSQTRKKYQGRIDKFFDFVGVQGKTPKEKGLKLLKKQDWTETNSVSSFILYQVDRVQNKETVALLSKII